MKSHLFVDAKLNHARGSFVPHRSQLDALPPDSEELSWGNSVYKIRFEERSERPLYGHRYWFYLKDAVDDVPEYVVRWDNFVKWVLQTRFLQYLLTYFRCRLAAEYGMHPVYKKEFHEVFQEHQEHPEFGPLLERMHVVDSNGGSQMDEDQWEAASKCLFVIYIITFTQYII